jgi:hypothetical protein
MGVFFCSLFNNTFSVSRLYSVNDRMVKWMMMEVTYVKAWEELMIMSMDWDCVPEVQSQIGLLFFPQLLDEHGEPWWDDIRGEDSKFVHWHLIFYFMRTTHELLQLVLYSERSWTYLHVLFQSSFSLIELLNMEVVWKFEVMLGQMLNHFVYNFFVILCNVILL